MDDKLLRDTIGALNRATAALTEVRNNLALLELRNDSVTMTAHEAVSEAHGERALFDS